MIQYDCQISADLVVPISDGLTPEEKAELAMVSELLTKAQKVREVKQKVNARQYLSFLNTSRRKNHFRTDRRLSESSKWECSYSQLSI